jgi:hypothetical protein
MAEYFPHNDLDCYRNMEYLSHDLSGSCGSLANHIVEIIVILFVS